MGKPVRIVERMFSPEELLKWKLYFRQIDSRAG